MRPCGHCLKVKKHSYEKITIAQFNLAWLTE